MPYRPYDQDQLFLLPPSLNEWLSRDHPARVFSEIIDRIDIRGFREPTVEGRPSYHPRMMVKALLWGYATGIRSSRKIEGRLKTDVAFMWLAGLEKPDFRTLCLFRTTNRELMERVFAEVVLLARSIGMGRLGLIALDGTKIQANAGIDSFKKVEAWRKELEKAKAEVRRIMTEAEERDKEEDRLYGDDRSGNELPEGMEEQSARVEKIEQLLKEVEQLDKEESGRVSSTDSDASFMHRKAGSLPAYNAQAAVTDDQLIVYADVTTEPIDVNQLKPALEGIEEIVKGKPEKVLADTGYSGGENLKVLESQGIEGYIPESGERNIGKIAGPRPGLFKKEDFSYDEERDRYICPAGKEMHPTARSKIKTKYSEKHITTYRTEKGICNSCHLKECCTANKKRGRAVTRDGYEVYRQTMREKLRTEKGREIYGKRKTLIEPVFGQMRTVGGFNQFLLRGIDKVRMEWKIGAIAHNLLKITRRVMEGSVELPEPA